MEVLLNDKIKINIWIQKGFAYGLLTRSETAKARYKITDYYNPESEKVIILNDSEINIKWPKIESMIVSGKRLLGSFLKLSELYDE